MKRIILVFVSVLLLISVNLYAQDGGAGADISEYSLEYIDSAEVDSPVADVSDPTADSGKINGKSDTAQSKESDSKTQADQELLSGALSINGIETGEGSDFLKALLGATGMRASLAGNSGAAVTSIPIEVPPGRNGMQPNISLNYNSNSDNGWLGAGWQLDMGAIRRNTKRGVDYNSDDYVFTLNSSSSELIYIGNTPEGYREYREKTEGNFSKYYKISDSGGWIVTTKNGTKYYYGTTSASRQVNSYGTFKWCLVRVQDTNGNYMTLTYWKDPAYNDIYLDRIDYTGNTAGLSPRNYILFYREYRSDIPAMYTTKTLVKTFYRFKSILVYGDGYISSQYELEYDADLTAPGLQYSNSTGQSLLGKVTRYGRDNASLPAASLSYFPEGNGTFGAFKTTKHATSGYEPPWKFDFADVNGDGKTDAIAYYIGSDTSAGTRLKAALANGDGTFGAFISTTHATSGYGSPWKFDFADVNGDGKTDAIAYYIGSTSGARLRVALSNGDGTFGAFISTTHATSGYGSPWKFAFTDINGDGKTDAVAYYIGSTAGTRLNVALSNGDGTFGAFINTTHATSGYGSPWKFAFTDINGDGKTDAVAYLIGTTDDKGTKLEVALSNGDGTFGSFQEKIHATSGYASPWGFTFADVNGDGMVDAIACYIGHPNGYGTKLHVAFSKGDGTFEDFITTTHATTGYKPPWKFAFADVNGDGKTDAVANYIGNTNSKGTNLKVAFSKGDGTFGDFITTTHATTGYIPPWKFAFADINGDGKTDAVANYIGDATNLAGTRLSVALSNGAAGNNLLNIISNGIGGATTLEYIPSSAYNNCIDFEGKNVCQPFVKQTLSSISVNNGSGNATITNYTYSGGYFDITDREYRGFEYVNVMDCLSYQSSICNSGPDSATTETWFYQDDVFKGLPYKQITSNSSDNVYRWTDNIYEQQVPPPYNGVSFPKLIQKNDYLCDGVVTVQQVLDGTAATCKQTQTQFTYDPYGNIRGNYFLGDVSVPDDQRYEYTEYYLDGEVGNYLVSLPKQKCISDTALTDCNESNVNLKAKESFTYYTTTGNLYKKTLWLKGGTNPVITYTYDPYGNIETTTDAKQNPPTRIDHEYTNTYPETIWNALGHYILVDFDYQFGKVLDKTEPNGKITTYDYDGFGRVKKITKPAPYGITEYFYQNFGNTTNQNIREELKDSSGTLIHWKETYFNGLGSTWREKSGGPGARTIIMDTESLLSKII